MVQQFIHGTQYIDELVMMRLKLWPGKVRHSVDVSAKPVYRPGYQGSHSVWSNLGTSA